MWLEDRPGFERRNQFGKLLRASQTRNLRYVPIATREFKPVERHTNASSFSESGRAEAGRCIARTSLYRYVLFFSRLYIFIVAEYSHRQGGQPAEVQSEIQSR